MAADRSFSRSLAPRGLVAAASLLLAGCSPLASGDSPVIQATLAAAPAATAAPPQAPPPQGATAGERLMAQGRYEEAVDEFTRALRQTGLETQPLSVAKQAAALYHQRGVAYLKMGFPDTAAADFTAALRLAPHHGDAFEARGRAYLALGDNFKALRDLTQAIRMQIDNAPAYQARGEVYLHRGQYDRAVADLEQAARKDPNLAEAARSLLSRAYLRWSEELAAEGDAVLAAEKLAQARQANAEYVDEQVLLAAATEPPAPVEQTAAKPVVSEAQQLLIAGREQQLAGQHDQALMSYTRAIALDPDLGEAYRRRGETLLATGFPDTALEDLKQAANRDHEPTAPALRLQAVAYLRLESPHRASLAATEALHADPTHGPTYALRGRAYLALENWSRSIADLEEAIRREPGLRPELEPLLAQALAAREEARERAASSEPPAAPDRAASPPTAN